MKYITIIAIIAITFLAAIALFKGIDTGVLTGAIASITGLGGYFIGKGQKSK